MPGTVAPPCRALNKQEESFPQTHRVAANENTPLRKNWGAVCSDVSYAVILQCILSLSLIKNKPKYLGFPCSLEYPGVPSRRWFFSLDFPRASEGRSFKWRRTSEPSARPQASAAAGACPAVPVFLLLFIRFCSLPQEKQCVAHGEGEQKSSATCWRHLQLCAGRGRGWDAVSTPVSRKYLQSSLFCPHCYSTSLWTHLLSHHRQIFHFSVEIELVKQKQMMLA